VPLACRFLIPNLNKMNNNSSRLGPVLFAISLLGSLVLIVMGIIFALDHAGAAMA
jgi:lipid-A-disaccharide synthase-like uncharacterized protein